jgi:hypothetical protein
MSLLPAQHRHQMLLLGSMAEIERMMQHDRCRQAWPRQSSHKNWENQSINSRKFLCQHRLGPGARTDATRYQQQVSNSTRTGAFRKIRWKVKFVQGVRMTPA